MNANLLRCPSKHKRRENATEAKMIGEMDAQKGLDMGLGPSLGRWRVRPVDIANFR